MATNKKPIKSSKTEVKTKAINVSVKIIGHDALLNELKAIQEATDRVKKALNEISFVVE